MNYAVEQRMRFIDFIVDTFGFLQRKHLSDFFGISTPQATKDINMYQKLYSDNVFYSMSSKRYLKHPEFKKRF